MRFVSPEIDRLQGANYTARAILNQSRQHTTYLLKVIWITFRGAADR
jgi:hypothetical protein